MNIDAKAIADFLNESLRLDPAAINSLFSTRRMCGTALAEHPTIQVFGKTNGPFFVRFIGILNGILLHHGSTDVLVSTVDDENNQNILSFGVKPYEDFVVKDAGQE